MRFIELVLLARDDVAAATADAAVARLTAGVEHYRRLRPSKKRGGRRDVFELLFDDGADGSGDRVGGLSGGLSMPRPPTMSIGRFAPSRLPGMAAVPGSDLKGAIAAKAEDMDSFPGAAGASRGTTGAFKGLVRQVVRRNSQLMDGAGARDEELAEASRVAHFAVEVDVVEAANLPNNGVSPRCVVAVGGEERCVRDGQHARNGRFTWAEHLRFERVYNLFGTDLECTVYSERPRGFGRAPLEQSAHRVVIPLASLDVDQPLDDWFLLSNGDGRLRLRLVLRAKETI